METVQTGELSELQLWVAHLANYAAKLHSLGAIGDSLIPYAEAAHKGQMRINQLMSVSITYPLTEEGE